VPNRNRQKGDSFEYRVKKFKEKEGWYVIRHPRSAFPDLIAIRLIDGQTRVELIECKVNKNGFSPRERIDILTLSDTLGATPYLAYRIGRKLFIEKVFSK